MSEKEINKYRFLSGHEPSDEMLQYVMHEVAEEAIARSREIEQKISADMQRRRRELREEWSHRLNNL